MTTIIATIDEVIDFLQKHKEKGYKYAIIAPDPVGGWSAPSGRRKYYQANFAVARDNAFSLALKRENGAEYWTGYEDALKDVLNAIQRREVRA